MEEVPNDVFDEAEEDMASRKSTKDEANPAPTALPAEVLESDDIKVPIERALHLRVLAGILGGQADDARVERALQLAQEVYELEIATAASLENYRSAGNAPES